MTREIALDKGLFAVVDDEDFEAVASKKWIAVMTAGVPRVRHFWRAGGQPYSVSLPRFLLTPPKGLVVDHIDGNTLNNARSNLRVCAQGENVCNRAKNRRGRGPFKGVLLHRKAWVAHITCDRIKYRLGIFPTAHDAALAYDAAALRMHGRFARLNFPENGEVRA